MPPTQKDIEDAAEITAKDIMRNEVVGDLERIEMAYVRGYADGYVDGMNEAESLIKKSVYEKDATIKVLQERLTTLLIKVN